MNYEEITKEIVNFENENEVKINKVFFEVYAGLNREPEKNKELIKFNSTGDLKVSCDGDTEAFERIEIENFNEETFLKVLEKFEKIKINETILYNCEKEANISLEEITGLTLEIVFYEDGFSETFVIAEKN